MSEVPSNLDNYTLPGTQRQPVRDAYSELGQVLRFDQPHPCLISSLAFVCGREVAKEARTIPPEQMSVRNLTNRYFPYLDGVMVPQRVFLDNPEIDEKIARNLAVKYANNPNDRILTPRFLSIVYSDFEQRLTSQDIENRLVPPGSAVSDLKKSLISHVVGGIQLPERPGSFLTWDTSRPDFPAIMNTSQLLTWIKDFGTVQYRGFKTPVPNTQAFLIPFNF